MKAGASSKVRGSRNARANVALAPLSFTEWLRVNPDYKGNYRIQLLGPRGGKIESYAKAKGYEVFYKRKRIASQDFGKKIKYVRDRRQFLNDFVLEYEKVRYLETVKIQLRRQRQAQKLARAEKRKLESKIKKSRKPSEKARKRIRVLKKKLSELNKKIPRLKSKVEVPAEATIEGVEANKKKRGLKLTERVKEKVVFSTLVSGRANIYENRQLHLRTSVFKHRSLVFDSISMDQVFREVEPVYLKELLRISKSRKSGQRVWILRLLYSYKLSNGEKIIRGFGIPREKTSSEKGLKEMMSSLFSYARYKFINEASGYFSRNFFPSEVELVGFTIENIDSVSREFKDAKLDKVTEAWEKEKNLMRKKALASRQKTIEGTR